MNCRFLYRMSGFLVAVVAAVTASGQQQANSAATASGQQQESATASGEQQESAAASGQQQGASGSQQGRPIPIQNPGFEERGAGGSVAGWQIAAPYEVREGAGRDGGAALVFDAETPPPYSIPNQGFSVKPGRSYLAGAWIKSENLSGGQAKVCLEWYDAQGRWIDGSYLIDGARGTSPEWRKFEVVASRLPQNAVFLRVCVHVEKGGAGRAFFDDVTVEEIPTKAVEGLYSDAYRNQAADGPITFFADLNLDTADVRPEEVEAAFSLPFANGRRTVPADALADNWTSVTVDAEKLENGPVEVVVRRRGATASGRQQAGDSKGIGEASLEFTRLEKEPTTGVRFDRHRRLIVEGRPFFPLGMYWGEVNVADLNLYAKGPFNCLISYDPNLTREHLDLCAAHGIKALYNLKDWYSFTKWAREGDRTRADADAQAERKILELRDHPALLGWYHNDEIGLQHIGEMTARYEQIKRLDPDHPAWSMLYQFTQTRDFLPSFDVTGTDPYPDGVTEEVRWSGQTRMTTQQRLDTFGRRPIWQAVLCYGNVYGRMAWGRNPDDPKLRPATEEVRNMAWQALTAGANGIFFYSFFDLKKGSERVGAPFEQAFAEVCSVAEEIKRFEDILLATESVKVVADTPKLGVRTWKRGDEVYLAVVNKRYEQTSGRVEVDAPTAMVETLLGPAPELAADGSLVFDLPACGVSFVRLGTASGRQKVK